MNILTVYGDGESLDEASLPTIRRFCTFGIRGAAERF
jgi:hypothetical protein